MLRHELQHTETMRQAMALGGLLPAGEPPLAGPAPRRAAPAGSRFPRPADRVGAGAEGFAYDNERPRHAVDVPRLRDRPPAGHQREWLRFAEGGGYVRREWWSDEGWAWKEEYDITHDAGVADGARRGARLPRLLVRGRRLRPCVRGAVSPPRPSGRRRRPRTSSDGTGHVWEWTSLHLRRLPRLQAHPYREYSEVFFGAEYRVLRGGSWATHPRVATATFRNWDLPQRRQIFAGVRLARDRWRST